MVPMLNIGDIKMYQATIFKESTEDSYQEGEIGDVSCFGKVGTVNGSTLSELLTELKNFLMCKSESLYIYNDVIEASILERDDSSNPTENEIELWKEGKLKLYNSRYTCDICEVSSKPVPVKELISIGLQEG